MSTAVPQELGASLVRGRLDSVRTGLTQLPLSVYVGIAVFLAVTLVAIVQSQLAPHDPHEIVGAVLAPPSEGHPLGLDFAGRDELSNVIYGARPSLVIGLAAALVSGVVGGTLGVVAGFMGGVVDRLITLVIDFFLVIPVLPLMIVLAALYGTRQTTLILIIGLLSWMPTARVISAQVKSVRERMFVIRSESLGVSRSYVMSRHVLPHVAPLLIATTSLVVGSAIFAEAALSFIGLGDPTSRSWGNQIAEAFRAGAVRNEAWPAILAPGLAIAAVVLAVNLIGRGVETALNPRLRMRDASKRRTDTTRRRPEAETDDA